MLVKDFADSLPLQYNNWGTESCSPKDTLFASSITGIWGMIVPNKMQMIRHACRFLENGEIYFEAGVLQGMSLICAAKDNSVMAIGVDNWSQFPSSEGNPIACRRALKESGIESRVELIEDDIKAVLTNRKFSPIGVYYYDASHDYFETLAGIELVLPHLADNAVIIVDDSAWSSPREAIERALSRYGQITNEHGRLEILFDMKSDDHQGVWTTGMIALRYQRYDG